MPLVSIIIPVYNVCNYLSKCLESIVNQTYKNLEIIIVDDGSTDGSGKIADMFARKYFNITVYHKENQGLSSARNYGIERANGDFYVFVDSDDYVDPAFVQVMVEQSNNADLVILNYLKVDSKGNILKKQDKGISQNELWTRNEFWKQYYLNGLWITCTVAWNKLYSKRVIRNIRFPIAKLHEDEFVIGSIIEKCKSVKVLTDNLYYYVQRNNSIMHSDYAGNLDFAEAMLKRYKLFSNNNSETMLKIRGITLYAASKGLIFGFFESKDKSRFMLLKQEFKKNVKQQLKVKKSINLFLRDQLVNFPMFGKLLMK